MKKFLVMAMAAAGVLTACTSNDDLGGGVNPADQQQIKLGVSNATVSTRGTGTVGDLASGENKWAGQYLWVYMLDKGSLDVAKYVDRTATEVSTEIFDNKLFVAPNEGDDTDSGIAKPEDGTIAYYPVTGNSDFWGYRVDDACNADPKATPTVKFCNENNEEVAEEAATRRVVDVTIDGSQDIMAGKAELDEEQTAKMGEGTRAADYFSAYAARKGVQPNIKFNHLLTRLTFQVKAGNQSATGDGANTNPVTVTKVAVESKTKGKLVVAHTETAPQLLTFEDAKSWLELKQRKANGTKNDMLEALTETPLTWDADNQVGNVLPIGEALLVAPGETEYSLKINLTQKVKVNEDGTEETKNLLLEAPIKINGDEFQAGNSYAVVVTVYGLEEIKVTATLVPWKDGGKIDIDDDNDPNTTYTPATPAQGTEEGE